MGADDLIRDLARNQHGVMSRLQLSEAGISRAAVLHRLRKGMLVPLSPKVLALAGSPPSEEQQAMAGVLDAPGRGYLSHGTALAWWRVPGFLISRPVQVVIPWQGTKIRTRLSEIHFHRGLPEHHLLVMGGLPVVSPTLAVFLAAGTLRKGKVERALDNVIAMRLGSVQGFHLLLGELAARGRNGIGLMRDLLAERPPGFIPPQSGLEARAEQLARDVGVRLIRQVNVHDEEWIGRVDFVLEDSPDVIEVLSDRYHGSLLDRQADQERFRRIEASGRRLLTLWDSDVWNRPEWVRQQILLFWREGSGP